MSTNVFVCDNPFQIMVSLILKMQINDVGESDIIITDRSSDMQQRYSQLKKLHLFRNVYYIKSKSCNDKTNKGSYFIRQTYCEFKGCYLSDARELSFDYSDVYAINVTCLTNYICHTLQKRGIIPNVHLYEEGFGCYTDHYYQHLFNVNHIRDCIKKISSFLFCRKQSLDLVKDLFLFEPSMLKWTPPFEIKKINKPDISNNDILKNQLNIVFDYNNDAELYQQTVIYFEDCIFQDTGDNRDFEIITRLAECVDKNDFLVKLHPRTTINRFEGIGIPTLKKKGLPWEIIVMNMKKDEKHIFVTVSSSSVVTYSLLFEKNYKSVLLFKCMPEFSQNIDHGIIDFLEDYAKENLDTILIPNTLDEAYNIFQAINYKKGYDNENGVYN